MMSCCHLIRAVFQSFTNEANTVLGFGYLAGLVLQEMTIHLLKSFSVQSDMRFWTKQNLPTLKGVPARLLPFTVYLHCRFQP